MSRASAGWSQRAATRVLGLVLRASRALRCKLTPAGRLAGALLVASAVLGLDTKETLIYQLFGLTLGLLVVAAAASARFRPRIAVSRTLPRLASAGVAFDYSLTVRNVGAAPHAALEVEDLLAAPLPSALEFFAFKRRADRRLSRFGRLFWYPPFARLARITRGAAIETGVVEHLAPSSERTLRLRCVPLRRGLLTFEAVRVGRPEPLGLMRAQHREALPEALLVVPPVHRIAPLALPGARRLQPGGVSFAGHVGDAEEFIGLRDFRPGDTPRKIHWKAWARTGRIVVKEHQEEFFVRHALVLDTCAVGDAPRLEAGVSLAASYVMMPRSPESLLDLMFVEDRAYAFTQGRGVGSAMGLLRVLALVQASPHGSFARLAEAVLRDAGRLSGGICVLLDWDEPRRRLVAELRARGVPLRVWLVRGDEQSNEVDPGPMRTDPGNLRIVRPDNLAQVLSQP